MTSPAMIQHAVKLVIWKFPVYCSLLFSTEQVVEQFQYYADEFVRRQCMMFVFHVSLMLFDFLSLLNAAAWPFL